MSSLARAAAHSFQVKWPSSDSLTASAKACACHGSANTGPSLSRGSFGSAERFSGLCIELDLLKVVIPHVYIHGVFLPGLPAPQLSRFKTHRIHMLRLLAKEMCVRVRENKNSMI